MRIAPVVLRRARESRRVSQRAMATALGCSQQVVAEREALDGSLLSGLTIDRWAEALGTTAADMLAEYDAREPPATRDGDPPHERFEPPGPARVAQLERLLKACGGNASQVARVLRVSGARIRELKVSMGLAR